MEGWVALVLAEVPASDEGPGLRVPTARVREGGLRVEGQEIVTSHALKPPKWCRGGGALWWRLRNPSCLGPGCSWGQEPRPQAGGRFPQGASSRGTQEAQRAQGTTAVL